MPKGKYKRKPRKVTRKPYRKKMAMLRQPFVEVKQKESEGQYALASTNVLHIVTGKWSVLLSV